MKNISVLVLMALGALVFSACSSPQTKSTQSPHFMQEDIQALHKSMLKGEKPKYIDKNNVGDTSWEKADQTDPSLIEGNLEDNDFKN